MYAPRMRLTRGSGGAGDLPEWYMPPQMIGGFVTGPALITRSDRVVVALRQVLAYPTGFEIELEAHARGSSAAETHDDPLDFAGQHRQLRFRLRLADGTDVIHDDEAGLRGGGGPALMVSKSERSSGGPENKEHIRLVLWASPLPPPGPLTLACSWPNRGLVGAELALDADAILVAAHEAQPFWPDEP